MTVIWSKYSRYHNFNYMLPIISNISSRSQKTRRARRFIHQHIDEPARACAAGLRSDIYFVTRTAAASTSLIVIKTPPATTHSTHHPTRAQELRAHFKGSIFARVLARAAQPRICGILCVYARCRCRVLRCSWLALLASLASAEYAECWRQLCVCRVFSRRRDGDGDGGHGSRRHRVRVRHA